MVSSKRKPWASRSANAGRSSAERRASFSSTGLGMRFLPSVFTRCRTVRYTPRMSAQKRSVTESSLRSSRRPIHGTSAHFPDPADPATRMLGCARTTSVC